MSGVIWFWSHFLHMKPKERRRFLEAINRKPVYNRNYRITHTVENWKYIEAIYMWKYVELWKLVLLLRFPRKAMLERISHFPIFSYMHFDYIFLTNMYLFCVKTDLHKEACEGQTMNWNYLQIEDSVTKFKWHHRKIIDNFTDTLQIHYNGFLF